jgi:hypothetical protein
MNQDETLFPLCSLENYDLQDDEASQEMQQENETQRQQDILAEDF